MPLYTNLLQNENLLHQHTLTTIEPTIMNNEKKIELSGIIPDACNGLRLDQALAKIFPQYSRAQYQNWIKQNHVMCNGETQNKTRYKVQATQTIEVKATLVDDERWEAQAIPLDIIYEDEDILIVNKPAGLVVHPGAGNPDNTLVNALLHHASELTHVPRAGIIHRLDKDTSGLLVVARNLASHNSLSKAMKERQINREYEAVVNGVMTGGGTIEADIDRHPNKRTQMAVVNSGRPAVTHYRVLHRFRAHTHIRVKLETGRTHQIRVHMAHIRHPLIGDPTYGRNVNFSSKLADYAREEVQKFNRQALHAIQLGFEHPRSNEYMQWKTDLPQDINHLIETLQRDHDENQ